MSADEPTPTEGPLGGLLEHMLDAFAYHRVVVDSAGQPIDYIFLHVNSAFERLTGLQRAQVLGRRVTEVLPGTENDPADWIGRFGGVGVTGIPAQFENYSEALDQWYHVSAYCPKPTHFAVVFENITERKRNEARQLQLIADLERKHAEMERVVYTVSHDLRGPLITVRSFAESLAESLAEGDVATARGDVERIQTAAGRLQRLLDDVLVLARLGMREGPAEDVDLGEVCKQVVELLAGLLVPRRVTVEVAAGLPRVKADPQRVLEIFLNLIENSAKFMGSEPRPRVRVTGRREGDRVLCSVTDNGIGIDARHLPRLFNLFHKVDPQAEGSGMGLPLVQRIVEGYGGRVWIESDGLGHGTTLWFTLPAA